MKFDKFGAFPKTDSPKTQSNNQLDISSLIKLIPTLFNKKKEEQPIPTENKNPYVPSNASAYAEYIARHDAFVKNSKTNKE